MNRHELIVAVMVTMIVPLVCLANPVVPGYAFFEDEAIAFDALKAMVLIVFVETLVLAVCFRRHYLPDHFVASLSANVFSSALGSLAFLTWRLDQPTWSEITPFLLALFVLGILLEFPLLRRFYMDAAPLAVLRACTIMNAFSYAFLWGLHTRFPHLFGASS